MPTREFGRFLRKKREKLRETNPAFSIRQVAERTGLEPSYLSKIERGLEAPPSEDRIRALADDLQEDHDILLALAGKVSTDLQEIIKRRPALFGELIREMKRMPDNAVLRLVREVRDGDW